jgi:type IX secretion system PorP/SprF family membrane protein
MARKILLHTLLFCFSFGFYAQDSHFSQYNLVPFWLNPAMVAGTNDVDVGVIYRTQYTGLNNPYNTYGAFADAAINKKRSKNYYFGLGVGFLQDNNQNVQYKSSLAALSLSYHLRVTRNNSISVGFQPFFFQKSMNYAGLKWGNQFDGYSYNSSLPTGESGAYSQQNKVDGSIGFNYQFSKGVHSSIVERAQKFQIGFSMFHLPFVRYSFYGSQETVYSRYTVNVSYSYKPANSKVSVNPVLFFQKQGPANEIIFGCNTLIILQEASGQQSFVKSSSLTLGVLYRMQDAIIITAGLNFERFCFSFAYDVNSSPLITSTHSFGAVELCIRYRLNKGHWNGVASRE